MTKHNAPAINWSICDLAATQTLYVHAGFVNLAAIPGPENTPALVHFRRAKYQDILATQETAVGGTATASFSAGAVERS